METNALSTNELRAKRWNAKIAREALDEFAANPSWPQRMSTDAIAK